MGLLELWLRYLKPPLIALGCIGPNPEIPLAWHWGLGAGLWYQVGQSVVCYSTLGCHSVCSLWLPLGHLTSICHIGVNVIIIIIQAKIAVICCMTKYDKGFSWRTFTFKVVT